MRRANYILVAAISLAVGCGRIEFDRVGDGGSGAPVLELTTEATVVSLDGNAAFEGTCTPSTDIAVTGESSATLPCDGTFRFEVTIADSGRFVWGLRPAGYPEAPPLVVTAVRDGDTPVITSFSIDAPSLIRNNLAPIDLMASDATTFVTAFCVDWTGIAMPAPDDPCWTPVDAPSPGLALGPTLTLDDFPFRLGFGAATYEVRAWVRDEAGNVSAPSDPASVQYVPGEPPVVVDVLATSVAAPSDPPTPADLTAPPGTPVYIKWAATDDEPLPASPVSLYYTTDDVTFVPIATDLENGANGACTVDEPGSTTDDDATGCFVWSTGPSVATYGRVRVAVDDSLGQRTSATSRPLNTPQFRFIAGNTDPGTDSSARAALFFGGVHPSSQSNPAPGNMVMTTDGG